MNWDVYQVVRRDKNVTTFSTGLKNMSKYYEIRLCVDIFEQPIKCSMTVDAFIDRHNDAPSEWCFAHAIECRLVL